MKKFYLLIFTLTLTYMLNGQGNDLNNLIGKSKPELSLYGGPAFEYHSSITSVKPGIEAGISINRSFAVGAYGHGTLTNFNTTLNETKYYNMLGEGGLLISFTAFISKKLHLGGLIKTGYAVLISDDKEIKMFESVDPVFDDGGWVYHPEAFAEVDLNKSIKVRLGVGYSVYNLKEEFVFSSDDLNCFTINLGLLFGKIDK